MSRLSIRTLALVAAFAATGAGAEELTITFELTGAPGGQGRQRGATATTYIGASAIRSSEGTTDSIYLIDSGRMLFVDHASRQYWETTEAELAAALGQLGEQLAPMKGMLGKMMGGSGEVKVGKGGEGRTIAGYACEHYVVESGQNLRLEFWTTSQLALPPQLYKSREAFLAGNPVLGDLFRRVYDAMRQVEGVPLAEKLELDLMGQKNASSREAIEVKPGPIAAEVFRAPQGYKKVAAPFGR